MTKDIEQQLQLNTRECAMFNNGGDSVHEGVTDAGTFNAAHACSFMSPQISDLSQPAGTFPQVRSNPVQLSWLETQQALTGLS